MMATYPRTEIQLRQLALARAKVAKLKTNYEELERAFQEQSHVAQLLDELSRQQEICSNAELRLRAGAADLYKSEDVRQPHPAVKIRLVRKLEYLENMAWEFCAEHLPKALKLDKRFFEKHCRAVADTDPISFVEIIQEPQVTIARDLSAYIEEPEPEEPERADDDLPDFRSREAKGYYPTERHEMHEEEVRY